MVPPNLHGSVYRMLIESSACLALLIRPFQQQLAAEAERVMAAHGLSQNDAQNFIRQVVQFASKSPDLDQTTLAFSQKTVQLMFKTELQVARELYALLLAKMCEVWPKVAKEAIDWLLFAEDPVRNLIFLLVPRILTFRYSASSMFR